MDSPNTVLQKRFETPTNAKSPWDPWPRPWRRPTPPAGAHVPDAFLNTAWIKDLDGAKAVVMYWTSEAGTTRLAVPITAVGLGSPQYIPQSDEAYRRASGMFGLGSHGSSDTTYVRIDKGRLVSLGPVGIRYEVACARWNHFY
jgi:hypothetical protein